MTDTDRKPPAATGSLFPGWTAALLAALVAMGDVCPRDAAAAASAPPEDGAALQVLFIGNSLTFYNDLPHMVAAIGAADGAGPVKIAVDSFTVGGATLRSLWRRDRGRQMLQSRHWDYVVLQESSDLPTEPHGADKVAEGMDPWIEAVRQAGAKPVLYGAWARQAGSDFYTHGRGAGSPAQMQGLIDQAIGGIAARYHIPAVLAGDSWARCAGQPGVPQLYFTDQHHPSVAGSYLTALLLYRQLTGHTPAPAGFVPPPLAPEQARALDSCAALAPAR